MAQGELLWALVREGSLEEMKRLHLESFDWNSTHPRTGITLLFQAIESTSSSLSFDEVLRKIEWLISQGASITQPCKPATKLEPHEETLREYEGQSALSWVLDGRALFSEPKMENDEEKAESAYRCLGLILSCFAKASSSKISKEALARVSIHEGIAHLWEKSLLAKDSHDLTIETADGQVTAHAHMLKEASSVAKAMLESPMKEGKAQRIEVKDTSSSAVSLFLEILYTCSAHCDPDYQTALQALDLAHRWQVDVVVEILSEVLSGMITDESFSAIGEHAILKGLERLKAAAQTFAASSPVLSSQFKEGHLPRVLAPLFPAASAEEPKPKRRRMWGSGKRVRAKSS